MFSYYSFQIYIEHRPLIRRQLATLFFHWPFWLVDFISPNQVNKKNAIMVPLEMSLIVDSPGLGTIEEGSKSAY